MLAIILSKLAKRILVKAARLGLDLNIKDNLKGILKTLGIDPAHIDQAWTELLNEMNKKKFANTPIETRIILLPQCLRDSEHCTAKTTPLGLVCNECGAKCAVQRVTDAAKKLGYKGVYVSPGGSMAINIVEKLRPEALIVVACGRELADGVHIARERGLDQIVPFQLLSLMTEGCIDTTVDENKLRTFLEMKE